MSERPLEGYERRMIEEIRAMTWRGPITPAKVQRRLRVGSVKAARLVQAMAHQCDQQCRCPIHGTPLLYSPAHDQHACQDVQCVNGHGMVEVCHLCERKGG